MIPVYHVDAFTDTPFSGNPAAVCILDEVQAERWMMAVASEMNLSETAFVHRHDDGFSLRWFTPAVEIDLCGHGTLACAHVLWEEGYLDRNSPARFHTRSGLLTARSMGEWIELDFPAEPDMPVEAPDGLLSALGAVPEYVGKNRFDYIVEVDSEETVRRMKPDFAVLGRIQARGFIVTARSASPDYDFVSRFFAPGAGINEDPVTGSAHCCLAPFWKERLGKSGFNARQVSARGGVLRVRLSGARVFICGRAVTVMRGNLMC